jgi:hypothetical protein
MSTIIRIGVVDCNGSPVDLRTASRALLPNGIIQYNVAAGATFRLNDIPEFGSSDVFLERLYLGGLGTDYNVRVSSGNLAGEPGGVGFAYTPQLFGPGPWTPNTPPFRNVLLPQGWLVGVNADTPATSAVITLIGYGVTENDWPDLQCCHLASPAILGQRIDGGNGGEVINGGGPIGGGS